MTKGSDEMFSKVYPFVDDKDFGIKFQRGTDYFVDGPRMHEFLQDINEKALGLYDTYTVGETYSPKLEECIRYVNEDRKELDSIFNFEHLAADCISNIKFFKSSDFFNILFVKYFSIHNL